ncbi:MAG: DUF192 domain-containing protein [Chloroflexi bacterium]|nr:DUF192 domain-containing protein [Chloroflexota bacterium]
MTAITNLTRGTVLAQRAETARNPWTQLVGLMGRAHLPPDSGLVLPATRGVHTHFMRFPIDVVFYDRNRVVLNVVHALRPWRFSPYHLRARGAVELPAGAARASGTQSGDVLAIQEEGP